METWEYFIPNEIQSMYSNEPDETNTSSHKFITDDLNLETHH